MNRLNHCKQERNVPEEKDGNDGNLDFFKQLNIQQEQIYANSNLNAYSNNDPISIKQTELKKIDIEKQRLIYEIQKLKKG